MAEPSRDVTSSPRTVQAHLPAEGTDPAVATLADAHPVQGEVTDSVVVGDVEGEVALAHAALPTSPPTVGGNRSNTDVGVLTSAGTCDVADVTTLEAELAAVQVAATTHMASDGDSAGVDELQDAEAEAEADAQPALSGVASHGDVADIADVAEIAEDEAEAEAEAGADARSDAAMADVGDVADLAEEAGSAAGTTTDVAAVASDIADLDVADLEDLAEEAAEGAPAGADGFESLDPELEGEEDNARYIEFAGGGSVSDLSAVVSEMNTDLKRQAGWPFMPPLAGGAGASSLGAGAGPSSLGSMQ